MAFWSRGGGFLPSLKVNFQAVFTVANVLQTLPASTGVVGLLNIELVELQRLAAVSGIVKHPDIEHIYYAIRAHSGEPYDCRRRRRSNRVGATRSLTGVHHAGYLHPCLR